MITTLMPSDEAKQFLIDSASIPLGRIRKGKTYLFYHRLQTRMDDRKRLMIYEGMVSQVDSTGLRFGIWVEGSTAIRWIEYGKQNIEWIARYII